jgi:hypothetical protein
MEDDEALAAARLLLRGREEVQAETRGHKSIKNG